MLRAQQREKQAFKMLERAQLALVAAQRDAEAAKAQGAAAEKRSIEARVSANKEKSSSVFFLYKEEEKHVQYAHYLSQAEADQAQKRAFAAEADAKRAREEAQQALARANAAHSRGCFDAGSLVDVYGRGRVPVRKILCVYVII